MKHLYLVRHGQTLFNEKKRVQGWCDSPLTEEGIAQIQAAGRVLNELGVKPDYCCSSDFERAWRSLELLADQPYDKFPELREMNFGMFEGEPEYLNPPYEEYETYFFNRGGEKASQVRERSFRKLTEIMRDPDHNTVLAVGHAGMILSFLEAIQADTEKIMSQCEMDNGSIFCLDFDPETDQFSFVDLINPAKRHSTE